MSRLIHYYRDSAVCCEHYECRLRWPLWGRPVRCFCASKCCGSLPSATHPVSHFPASPVWLVEYRTVHPRGVRHLPAHDPLVRCGHPRGVTPVLFGGCLTPCRMPCSICMAYVVKRSGCGCQKLSFLSEGDREVDPAAQCMERGCVAKEEVADLTLQTPPRHHSPPGPPRSSQAMELQQ